MAASLVTSVRMKKTDTESEKQALDRLSAEVLKMVSGDTGAFTLYSSVVFDSESVQQKDEQVQIILLKFLRARDFAWQEAADMFRAAVQWHKDQDIDNIIAEDHGEEYAGHDRWLERSDRLGRPILISTMGTMPSSIFNDTDKFVRWRVQIMEKGIQLLAPFKKDSPESFYQIHDFKNVNFVSGDFPQMKKCLKPFSKTMADCYPEFKGKTMFVNFPGILVGVFKLFSVFIPKKTRNKFSLCSSHPGYELLHDVSPEVLPAEYGGLDDGKSGIPSTVCGNFSIIPILSNCYTGSECNYQFEFEVSSDAQDQHTIEVEVAVVEGTVSYRLEGSVITEWLELNAEDGIARFNKLLLQADTQGGKVQVNLSFRNKSFAFSKYVVHRVWLRERKIVLALD